MHDAIPPKRGTHTDNDLQEMVRYYAEAGPDYEAWSRRFNMHFGYWRKGLNPFKLERMLDEMTAQVASRLGLVPGRAAHLLDMGCGLGTSARYLSRRDSALRLTGITIVPWQVRRAIAKTEAAGLQKRVDFVLGDYTDSPFPDEHFDGIYAIESACHGKGDDKGGFLAEAARLLKPGSKLVVADGFLKSDRPMNPLLRRCYHKMCHCWAMDAFAVRDRFLATMARLGFEEIQVTEISVRIAPSVLHIPRVTLAFLWKTLRSDQPMTEKRWNNCIAPILAMPFGMAHTVFGYYLISARKAR